MRRDGHNHIKNPVTGGTPYDEVLRHFYDSASAGAFGQLMAAQAALANDTALAASILSNFNPDNNAEENERTVYEIYLASFARENYDLTQEQSEILYNIATQHPVSGGTVVYSARAMLDLFVDDSDEFNSGRSGQFFSKKKSGNTLKLIPNPAHEYVRFNYRINEGETAVAAVYNAAGQLLYRQALTGSSYHQKILLHQFNPGIYTLKVTGPSGKNEYGKLIIIR